MAWCLTLYHYSINCWALSIFNYCNFDPTSFYNDTLLLSVIQGGHCGGSGFPMYSHMYYFSLSDNLAFSTNSLVTSILLLECAITESAETE